MPAFILSISSFNTIIGSIARDAAPQCAIMPTRGKRDIKCNCNRS